MGRAEEYRKRAEAAEEQANKERDLKREEASWTLPPSMSGSWPSTERELVARQLGDLKYGVIGVSSKAPGLRGNAAQTIAQKRNSENRSKELRERRAGVIKSAKDETKRRRLGVHGRKSG